MNIIPALTSRNLCSVFELDAEGTVYYSRVRNNKEVFETEPDLIGRNFFDEIAALENVEDLRRRFRYFIKGSGSTENFNFDFRFSENTIPAKIMLVRICETEYNGNTNLVIVDIRKIESR